MTATDAPDGAFGILAVLSAVVLIADLGVERLSPGTALPNIGGSRTQTRFVLACITALFVVLKFVFNIHFSDFGFGFYLRRRPHRRTRVGRVPDAQRHVGRGQHPRRPVGHSEKVAAAEWCSSHAFAAARSSPRSARWCWSLLMFAVPWVSFANPGGGRTSADAWTSFPTLRWPLLVTAALGLLLGYLQVTRSAPAFPVALDVVLVTLAAIMTLVLLIRLLTGAGSPQGGGWLGLVATAALTAGAFKSLRQEAGWEPGPDHPVETVELSRTDEQH